jgi:hypothetical protein
MQRENRSAVVAVAACAAAVTALGLFWVVRSRTKAEPAEASFEHAGRPAVATKPELARVSAARAEAVRQYTSPGQDLEAIATVPAAVGVSLQEARRVEAARSADRQREASRAEASSRDETHRAREEEALLQAEQLEAVQCAAAEDREASELALEEAKARREAEETMATQAHRALEDAKRGQREAEMAEQRRLQDQAAQRHLLEAEAAEARRAEAAAAEQRRREAEAAEQRREEAEAAEMRLLEAEAEQRRVEAAVAEKRRLEAEAAEQRRLEAEADEQRRGEAEAAEKRRIEAAAAEVHRVEAAAAEKRRLDAEATERRRLEDEQRRIEVAAAEVVRVEAAAAVQRRAEATAAEQRRLETEEQRRLEEADAEQRRLEVAAAEAAELRRREAAAAEERRLEVEQRRREAEAAEQRREEAEAAEMRLLEAEAEQRRVEAAVAEKRRQEAEAAEQRRLEAEAAEQRRVEADAAEQRRIEAAAAEAHRMEAAAAEKRRSDAEATERRRLEDERSRMEAAAAAERRRRQDAAIEQSRVEVEATAMRLFAQAEQCRMELAVAEQRHLEAEAAEQRRLHDAEADVNQRTTVTSRLSDSAVARELRERSCALRDTRPRDFVFVAGIRAPVSAFGKFLPLAPAASVQHPLCTLTWVHPELAGFEITMQAEDLRFQRRPFDAAQYDRAALETINAVFGSTDSVKVIESCRAAHVTSTTVFAKFSHMVVYTAGEEGTNGIDVRCFTAVRDGVGYSLVYHAPFENDAASDTFFKVVESCDWDAGFAGLVSDRAAAGEAIVHSREAPHGHTLVVRCGAEWIAKDTSRVAVELVAASDPRKFVTLSTQAPHSSQIQVSDIVNSVCNGLVCVHAAASLSSAELAAIIAGVRVDPPNTSDVEPAMVFDGIDVSFSLPALPNTYILSKRFERDASVATVIIRGTAVEEVYADIHITPVIMPRGTSLTQMQQLTARHCDEPQLLAAGHAAVVSGASARLGPGVHIEYRVLDLGPVGAEGHQAFGVLRMTCPRSMEKQFGTALSSVADSVVFALDA